MRPKIRLHDRDQVKEETDTIRAECHEHGSGRHQEGEELRRDRLQGGHGTGEGHQRPRSLPHRISKMSFHC
ncbi:UNVERIFIED_CONTAM: hypothetical protein PYX00_010592 [Menopon gallinae]|uniref:Uncharacterized protein n=1 Tax=Menopon gallinae TaxID=328185 RepID=A0AAW2HGQ6_9NEOP